MGGAAQYLRYPLVVWEKLRRAVRRLGHYTALQSARLAPAAKAFVSQPETRSFGSATRGIQILAGNHLVNGDVVECPECSLWDLPIDDTVFLEPFHSFDWLDDLAGVETAQARQKAQEWVFDWIIRYGSGLGAGWSPDLTGRRVMHWTNHAILILNQAGSEQSRAFFKSLGHQSRFLRKRWQSVPPGLPRFEALAGLVACGLALEGQARVLDPALRALDQEAARQIHRDGGIESRNPEELMEIFTLLSWVNQAVSRTDLKIGSELLLALERMAPAIRSLRMGDGRMARFHSGESGRASRIDQALADAGIRTPARIEGTMGYSRLSAMGTTVVVDTGALPKGDYVRRAHAGTLSFEMSSGTMPLLCNMGPARGFDEKTRRAARATAAHNGVDLNGLSLARFSKGNKVYPMEAPRVVSVQRDENPHGQAILASHDGYRHSHGLIHTRQIALLKNGREIQGQDRLSATSSSDRLRFQEALRAQDEAEYLPFSAHFRVHSDVMVELGIGGTVASFVLGRGETWLLQMPGAAISILDTVCFEEGRLKPRATKQIVATSAVLDYEGVINWTLSRHE